MRQNDLLKIAKDEQNFFVHNGRYTAAIMDPESGEMIPVNPLIANINTPFFDITFQYISAHNLQIIFNKTVKLGMPVTTFKEVNNINMEIYGFLRRTLCENAYIHNSWVYDFGGLLAEVMIFEDEDEDDKNIGFLVLNVSSFRPSNQCLMNIVTEEEGNTTWGPICCPNMFVLQNRIRVVTEPRTTNGFIEGILKQL